MKKKNIEDVQPKKMLKIKKDKKLKGEMKKD